MKLSLIKYPVSGGGGSTSPAGSNTQVQFNNAGVFGASAAFTYSDTGFASAFPSLIITDSNLPSIQILTNTDTTDNNGPVLFFGNTLTEGLIWQFFMPAASKGFGAFNRNVFDYSYYCTFDTNNTIIGGTTHSGTPPHDDGNKLQVNGSMSLTDVAGARLFFEYGSAGGGDVTSQMSGVPQLSFGFANNATYGGTTGTDSGRYMYFFDRITSTFRGGFDATGTLYWGPTNLNYNLSIAVPNSGVAGGLSIDATGITSIVVSDFLDNTAALAGGLVIGQIYRNGDILQIVH